MQKGGARARFVSSAIGGRIRAETGDGGIPFIARIGWIVISKLRVVECVEGFETEFERSRLLQENFSRE